MDNKTKRPDDTYMPSEEKFQSGLNTRNLWGNIWRAFYFASILVAILALIVLFMNVINSAFGSIATSFEIDPSELVAEGQSLNELSAEELVAILIEREPNRLPVLVRDNLSILPNEEFTEATLSELRPNGTYPEGYADVTINEIRDADNTAEVLGEFLAGNLSRNQILAIVEEDIVALQVVDAWVLWDALFNYEPTEEEQAQLEALPLEIADIEAQISTLNENIADIEAEVTTLREESASDNATEIRDLNAQVSDLQSEVSSLTSTLNDTQRELTSLITSNVVTDKEANYPDATLVRFHSWIDGRFLQDPMSSVPAQAGIRTALIGSIMMMVIVILVSLPLGVGAAIYLEEYAKDNLLAQIPRAIENGLSNVPMPQWLKNRIIGMSNLNQIIETNVRNLAGVPSIIYGMLGLAIFVRILAPFTSGIIFGVNSNPPPVSRVVSTIEEPEVLGIDLELDDNYQIVSYTGPEFIDEVQAQRLVNTFRRLGTPSVTNTGNLSLERTDQEIGNLFGIRFLDDIPTNADPLEYERVAAGYVELDALPMTLEQFEALAQQLRRITAFTVSGRTVLSAALTLSLLILPVIIINSQEALRAVPSALREASYGLGATKWQTIWQTVLPSAIPGIMTGTILAVSRAVGETAPLIVVGASTFLLTDPTGPFSQFTALPIQIFQWTSRPQGQFQFIAAAAIIILLSMVLALNAIAIVIRNRYTTRF